MNEKLIELLTIEAKEIAFSFQKARLEGEGTPQEVADRREECFKSFLSKYFPFPYRIVKGNIRDSYGNSSYSIDCIVLNPSHPHTIDPNNDKASFIFADGVDFAIEIKSDLSNKNELKRALLQIQSVKKLRRVKHTLFIESNPSDESIEYRKTVPGIIVADKAYEDPRKLIESIYAFYNENQVPPIEQFDLLLVNNRYLMYNVRPNAYYCHKDSYCLGYGEYREKSIAALLYELNTLPHCEMLMGENVMKIYLEGIRVENLTHCPDLDIKYRGKQ